MITYVTYRIDTGLIVQVMRHSRPVDCSIYSPPDGCAVLHAAEWPDGAAPHECMVDLSGETPRVILKNSGGPHD